MEIITLGKSPLHQDHGVNEFDFIAKYGLRVH